QPRPDRHRDHVLVEPLLVADAGVATGGEDIDEALLGDDLDDNARIFPEEGRHDVGQHQPHRAHRHVELQRAYRPVAKGVDRIERRVELAQDRIEPLQEVAAGLGRRHAAGGAVQQPHAETRLQPPHRIAEPRRAGAAQSRRLAKAAGAHHRRKGVEIVEVQLHCPPCRTARADYGRLSRQSASSTSAAGTVADARRPHRNQETKMSNLDKAGTFRLGDRTVKRIGYGAMQLAGPHVFGPPRDPDAARAVLREAIALGVDHIDTSDYYGPHVTNQLIRDALAPYPRDLTIVSKIGARRGDDASWLVADSPAELRRQVEGNLTRLGIEALDVVNLRFMFAMGPAEGDIEPALTAVAELQRQGLVRHIGVSNVTPAQVAAARRITPIVCVQNQYNLAHRQDDALIDALAA